MLNPEEDDTDDQEEVTRAEAQQQKADYCITSSSI